MNFIIFLLLLYFLLYFLVSFIRFMGNVKAYLERKGNESKTKLGEIYYKNVFTVIVRLIVILVCVFFIYCIYITAITPNYSEMMICSETTDGRGRHCERL